MNRFFTLPEMVATVLAADSVDDDMLASCLCVNRLFSHETTRVLWDRCGSHFPIGDARRRREPTVKDLARVAAVDAARGQYYATFVRDLRLTPSEQWPKTSDNEQWQTQLLQLRFPTLEHLYSDATASSASILQAGVLYDMRFPLRRGRGLFWHLVKNSPKLRSLGLAVEEPAELFESGPVQDEAVELIESSPLLSALRITESADNLDLKLWPPRVLAALARHSALEALEAPGINLTSDDLEALSTDAFPKLCKLTTRYTGPTCRVATAFPRLTSLTLDLLEPSSSLLAGLERLTLLTSLSVQMPADAGDCSISASQLLTIAHACPRLAHFNVPPAHVLMMEDALPDGVGIDDETIEGLARALPLLDTFCFGIEARASITHCSLLSLARYCPHLGYVYLAAQMRVPDLITGLQALERQIGRPPLGSVMYLRIIMDADEQNEYPDVKLEELAAVFARDLAPKLCEFDIINGSADDDAFVAHIEGQLANRV